MDSLAADGQCNIDPVIDEKWDVVLLTLLVQPFRR
jgi:hypothetical protein